MLQAPIQSGRRGGHTADVDEGWPRRVRALSIAWGGPFFISDSTKVVSWWTRTASWCSPCGRDRSCPRSDDLHAGQRRAALRRVVEEEPAVRSAGNIVRPIWIR